MIAACRPCPALPRQPARVVAALRWAAAVGGQGGGATNHVPSAEALSRLAGRRILVLEDEALIAMDIALTLEDWNAVVIGPAHSFEEGLELADRERLDAAVLDVNLRGKEVFPVAELLRSRGVPFLFHTGHETRASLQDRFPRIIVCQKPVLSEVLAEAVGRLLP